jgi:hypothetical protein
MQAAGIDSRRCRLFTKAAVARRYSDQTASTVSSLSDHEDNLDVMLSPPRSPVKLSSPPRSPVKFSSPPRSPVKITRSTSIENSPLESPMKMGAPSTKLLMSVIAQEMARSLVRATATTGRCSSLDDSDHSNSSDGSAMSKQLADLEALLKTMTDKRDNPEDLTAYLMSKLQMQDQSMTECSESEVEETAVEIFHPGFLANSSTMKSFDEAAELISPVKKSRDFSYSTPPSSPGRRLQDMLTSLPEIMSESGHDDSDDDEDEDEEFALVDSPVKKRQSFDYIAPPPRRSSGQGLQEMMERSLPEIMSDDDDSECMDDQISVISDITEFTGITGVSEFTESTQKELPKAAPKPAVTRTMSTRLPSPPKPIKSKKSVSFGKVDVRSYERIMSDNPGSANGPSIGIGWAFAQEETETVDAFDKDRQGTRKQKRSKILLNEKKRERLLLKLGYSEKDIAEMVRKTNKNRNQRRNTITNLENARMEEVVENARRMVAQALFLKKERKIALQNRVEC